MEGIMAKLQAPFTPEEIEWRVGNANKEKLKGMALAYVTNRAIQNRLDDVFGVFGWKNEFREWRNNSQLCGISVKVEGEWVTKWDGADDSDFESTKGGLSDAMKRAAYQWGIGRYLYELDAPWMPIKPQGKSFVLVKTPELPDWALPEGYVKPKQTKTEPKEAPAPWDDDFGGTVVDEGDPVITEKQRARLFALAKQNSFADEELRNLLGSYGYETSKEVKRKDYQKICNIIEGKEAE